MAKIVICIDGTGNEIGDRESNVLKLYKALAKTDDQIVHYVMGVGTYGGPQFLGRTRQVITGLLGQAFGYGLEDDVLSAYRVLCTQYRSKERKRADDPGLSADAAENDHIHIIGFSRGAYAARMLAGFIHNFGLVEPARLHLITPVFRAYRYVSDHEATEPDNKVFQSLREYERALDPSPAPIRALLLFDTVSSMLRFRRPLYNLRKFGSFIEFGTHPSVNANVSVRIIAHALGAHDRRSLFRAQHWQPEIDDETGQPVYYGNNFRNPKSKRQQYVRQRWFPGFHSDVGGSPPENESGLGKISALWMLDALAEMEKAADTEDNAHRKTARRAKLPGRRAYGLALKRSARKRYLEGAVAAARTPGGLPYAPPDPNAPLHNSHTHGLLAPLWVLLELFPKSALRREQGPVAWFRRAILWKWYFPLFEPRHIPTEDERDPSLSARD
ncbi:DUF2235 domain-containing protein [Aquicoccus sp. G2-2]|uniref:T6SS phospholipase effector Tle1-like catalytic domain-containing protein n=1 Tax=Aquicoccus sp. G2-2 TaxID=3092120 RepID=UPI002AE0109F|nr:DUF2235 domain-containing protein [Aquicoccus sp. G2-2]MEA1113396.1 DUF2235 domain-containing protein [Aquicoccus sp. G2-2]